jgi:hypothetical protein
MINVWAGCFILSPYLGRKCVPAIMHSPHSDSWGFQLLLLDSLSRTRHGDGRSVRTRYLHSFVL